MAQLSVGDAAALLGISPDTMRRWADHGKVKSTRTASGRRHIDAADLARVAGEMSEPPNAGPIVGQSARNRFTGIVTRVVKDTVMAQVELQAGPFRVVSLMSSEAATELGLEPGKLAVASIKATQVVVELPVQPLEANDHR